ncbi:hypothetical protein WUBG_11951 [Wuchereria bancrofti]|uniref:Uncharacterized protein n=1 Tax=Wuchereria bancrofti TaxID=6293 RepID=J9E4T0_WUCBA|nr:hypothetical protein WUBG_11951 [Wuchereria bancrofti]
MITIPILSLHPSAAYFSIVKESLGRTRSGKLDGTTVFVYSQTVWSNIRERSIIAKKKIRKKLQKFLNLLCMVIDFLQIFPELRFSTGNIRNESRDLELREIDNSNDA